MTSRVLELFGVSTLATSADWKSLASRQPCPFLGRKCLKVRKSDPSVSIGSCAVGVGKDPVPLIICPKRLLERRQVFTDCLPLLTAHEKGNELHIVQEIEVPGGSVDYLVVSARDRKTRDFVGVELQTLDTMGTVWPERQRFLAEHGVPVRKKDAQSRSGFGVNWKMTAKTTLVQLHHKVTTFEHVNRKLVLVVQDMLLAYMQREFSFAHLRPSLLSDPLHIHSYKIRQDRKRFSIAFDGALSTDAAGVAAALGIKSNPRVELDVMLAAIDAKLSAKTLLQL